VAHASIFLGNEHLDVSLGRVAVRKAGAHEPTMPDVSKFRATKPRIEDADVHVRFARQPITVIRGKVLTDFERSCVRGSAQWEYHMLVRCRGTPIYPSPRCLHQNSSSF
jgi:hypothetical protein